jgi:hypothetical protein
MRKGTTVNKLQLAANRHTMRNAGDADRVLL